MRTDDLIAALGQSVASVDAAAAERRFAAKAAGAVVLSFLAMLVFLGPRPDLEAVATLPMFWMKLTFPASMAAVALALLHRLAYPGSRLGAVPFALALPLAVVWLVAGASVASAPSQDRLGLVLGASWWQCPVSIGLLSVPAFVLAFSALRGLAPTRLALAGCIAGLFAGAAATLAYALHCTEMEAPFLAVWYVLGMAVPAAVGAALGRRLLRW
jgi:hypothetical protein